MASTMPHGGVGSHDRACLKPKKGGWGQGAESSGRVHLFFLKGVAPPFIPRAILAFLWNPLSGATPFRQKERVTTAWA